MGYRRLPDQLSNYSVNNSHRNSLLRLTFSNGDLLYLTSEDWTHHHYRLALEFVPDTVERFVEAKRYVVSDYAYLCEATVGHVVTIYVGDAKGYEDFIVTKYRLARIELASLKEARRHPSSIVLGHR